MMMVLDPFHSQSEQDKNKEPKRKRDAHMEQTNER